MNEKPSVTITRREVVNLKLESAAKHWAYDPFRDVYYPNKPADARVTAQTVAADTPL